MDKIEELLTRGVEKIYPSKEELEKVLRSGKKLKLYQGFDPTGTQLHIGHMVGFRKLRQWQELGHEVIFLIGDFTAMVGDPTGKMDSRNLLTKEEVLKNAESYKEQAGKIIQFSGSNPVKIRYNSEWLGKMSVIEFLELAHHLTYAQVIERDMFQERLKKGQDVFMNEFLYPFMQAYDSVAMEVDLELGGSDQMFNMMMGRKLMRNVLKKNKFVMTTPLLTDSEGMKIGKTEGNVIALTDAPEDLLGKIMALGDDVIVKGLEYLTDVPVEEIQTINKALQNGENPIKYKKRLAFEIVKQLYSQVDADKAQEHFEKTVQQKKMPQEIPIVIVPDSLKSGATIADALVAFDLVESKSDAKRVIYQAGTVVNDEVVKDPNAEFIPANGTIIHVGPISKGKIVKIEN